MGLKDRVMHIKRPNKIIYFLAYILVMPFLKIFFKLEIVKSDFNPPKGPIIAVCNHGSFMDFAVSMLSLYPLKFNAVAAQKFFYYKPLHRFLPMMGCIPKNLFDADIRTIVGIKKVLERGDNVILFPEGRCECDGSYAGIHTATGKLLKKLKVPVVSCSIDGAYGCMPFWRKGMRFGRVRIVLSDLFTSWDLHRLSAVDINKAIDSRLSREQDAPPTRPLGAFFNRKLAEGLENILYWCHNCGAEFSTQTSGNLITCKACGNIAQLDGDMNFSPVGTKSTAVSNVHEWFKAQAKYEAERLSEYAERIKGEASPAPYVTVNVDVRLPSEIPGAGMVKSGSGVIKMDCNGWHFDGQLRGGQASLHFPFAAAPALPIDPDDVFQIYSGGVFYCFVPERPREVIKYSVIGECAYWLFTDEPCMTPRYDSGFC